MCKVVLFSIGLLLGLMSCKEDDEPGTNFNCDVNTDLVTASGTANGQAICFRNQGLADVGDIDYRNDSSIIGIGFVNGFYENSLQSVEGEKVLVAYLDNPTRQPVSFGKEYTAIGGEFQYRELTSDPVSKANFVSGKVIFEGNNLSGDRFDNHLFYGTYDLTYNDQETREDWHHVGRFSFNK